MIFVILPLGKEAKEITAWLVRAIMYAAGSTLGAGLLALLIGGVGRGLGLVLANLGVQQAAMTVAVVVLGVASLLFALHELNIIKMPNPQIGWQVPKSWMRSSRLTGNTLYGIVLGAGIFTFIPFTSFYVLLGWEFVAGMASVKAAVALGMLYGAARGIPAIAGGISMLRGSYPMPVSNWLIAHLGWWHAINALALLLVGSFLLASFII